MWGSGCGCERRNTDIPLPWGRTHISPHSQIPMMPWSPSPRTSQCQGLLAGLEWGHLCPGTALPCPWARLSTGVLLVARPHPAKQHSATNPALCWGPPAAAHSRRCQQDYGRGAGPVSPCCDSRKATTGSGCAHQDWWLCSVLLPGGQQHIAYIYTVTSNTRPGSFSKMSRGLEVKDIFHSQAFPSCHWEYMIVLCKQDKASRSV